MDFLEILVSVNKISVILFIVTILVLGYEFYLFKKERDRAEKPNIPEFDEKAAKPLTYTNIATPQEAVPPEISRKSKTTSLIVVTAIFLIFFGVISAIGIFNFSRPKPIPPIGIKATPPSPTFTPTPTQVLLAQEEEPTPTATPEAVVSTETPTITPEESPIATETATETETTATPTTETESIPQAGFTQYSSILFFTAALILFVSFLF